MRRTGAYAGQSIDGTLGAGSSTGLIQPNMMNQRTFTAIDSQYKQVFEDNMPELIHNVNVCQMNSHRLNLILMAEQQQIDLKKHIDANNMKVKEFLKTKYQYEFCTTSISIHLKALDDPQTQ